MTDCHMAEWISGIGSLLAVIVALGGYWLVERHRAHDEQSRRQAAAYQIAFKLSALASESNVTHEHLNPPGRSSEDWLAENDPMVICATLPINISSAESISRDLSEAEQNLLMSLGEEDFLMDFSEAFARNRSIEAGLLEFNRRREEITKMLPPPTSFAGQVGTLTLTQTQKSQVMPHVVATSSLVQSMRALSKQNVEQLDSLSERLTPMFKRHFPKLHVHKLEKSPEA